MVGGNEEGADLLRPETGDGTTAQTLPCPPKPWWQSRVVWSGVVTIAFSALGAAGIAHTDADIEQWTELLAQMAPMIMTAAAGVVGIYYRRKTNSPISGGPADPKVIARAKLDKARSEAVKRL